MSTNFTSITAVAVFCLSCALPLAGTTAAEAVLTQPQAPGTPRVFLLDAKYLQSARQQLRAGDQSLAPALAQLERDAQAALDAGPFSVVNKKVTPPSGDKRDHMSQAPYFWPNPDTTNGLPYVRRDGERNPEINPISDHRSLAKALDYLAPFALGQQKWPHRQIGGWPPQMLFPLLRQAALKLSDRKYRDWVKQLPPVEPTSRSNLLRPKVTEHLGVTE